MKTYKALFFLIIIVFIGIILRMDQVIPGNWYIISDKGRDILVASHLAHTNVWQTAITPHSGSGGEQLHDSPLSNIIFALLYRYFPDPVTISAILTVFCSLLIVFAFAIGYRFGGLFGAVMTGTVFATSFVIIDYTSHMNQIMVTPVVVGVILWALYEAYREKDYRKKLFYCLVSIIAIFTGLLVNHVFLGILPICMILWFYFGVAVRSVRYRLILIIAVISGFVAYISFCHIDLSKFFTAASTVPAGRISYPDIIKLTSRAALFYPALKASWTVAAAIPLGIVFWFFQRKHSAHQKKFLILLVLILLSGCIAVSAPKIFYEHYFLPYYAVALLLFSLLLSLNSSIFPRILAVGIVAAFVVHQYPLLLEHQKNHFSLRDAGLIADVIRQGTFMKNNEPFSIVLPTAEMEGIDRISEWNSGGIWYALEQKTGKQFVEIVPEEKSLNNISVPHGGSNYIVICFDNPPSKFFRLNVCLSDWKAMHPYDLRLLSRISVTNNTYYVYETY